MEASKMQKELDVMFKEAIVSLPVVQHIERFNTLIHEWVPDLLPYCANIDTIVLRKSGKYYQFRFLLSNYEAVRQPIMPDEAQARNLNYAFDMVVDVRMEVYEVLHDQEEQDTNQNEQPETKKETNQPIQKKRKRKSTHTRHDQLNTRQVCEPKTERLVLCSFPAMLRSQVCTLSDGGVQTSPLQDDVGGSFITRGKRKFVPFLERRQYNRPYFLYDAKNKYKYCEIRSEHLDRRLRSTSTLRIAHHVRSHTIIIGIPFFNENKPIVPLRILLLALGMPWEDCVKALRSLTPDDVWNDDRIRRCRLRMSYGHTAVTTSFDAGQAIARLNPNRNPVEKDKNHRYVQNTLDSEVLPHLNIDNESRETLYRRKALYIIWCVSTLWKYMIDKIEETNQDDYCNKALDGAAELLGSMFRQRLTQFQKYTEKQLRRVLNSNPGKDAVKNINIRSLYKAERLTPKIMQAVSSGKWSEKRQGMTQALRCINQHLIRSQLRVVKSPLIGKKGKHLGARQIHPSSYGYMCAASTPEGKHVGLTHSLASTCQVTRECSAKALTELLLNYVLADIFVKIDMATSILQDYKHDQHTMLFGPNGVLWGWVTDKSETLRRIRQARRNNEIDHHVSVYYDDKITHSIHVKTSSGRLTRPLLVAENIHKLPDLWRRYSPRRGTVNFMSMLIQHGVVEYIDTAEQYNCSILLHLADIQQYDQKTIKTITHLELSDIASVGSSAALIPYFRHNQGPRTVYGVSMLDQFISTNSPDDIGTKTNRRLHYGQSRLIHTSFVRPDMQDGVNCVVAIIPHQANQEDAVVIKKEALERGLFTSTCTKTHTATYTPRGNSSKNQDKFCRPDRKTTLSMKHADYSKLQDDGVPAVGTHVKPGDVIIGRVVPNANRIEGNNWNKIKMPSTRTQTENNRQYRDASIQAGHDECGVVSEVALTDRGRRVRIQTVNHLEMGDKLSDCHGQKGVIGAILPSIDMPRTASGIVPDILINPCGFPSRMTIGKLIEMLSGKASALSGKWKTLGLDQQYFDQQATHESLQKIMKILTNLGYSKLGNEVMYDGITGEMYGHYDEKGHFTPATIFQGIVYVSKMDHMVSKKFHARARGPIDASSRQPTRGRKKDGGLRTGYMEIEAKAAHGASALLQSQTTTVSDVVTIYVCKQCGNKGAGNPGIGYFMCHVCKTGKHIHKVKQSFSTNAMFTYLEAGGIKVSMKLKPKDEANQQPLKRRKPDSETNNPPKRS
jgi:DNA-directed RNA polymerase subunit B